MHRIKLIISVLQGDPKEKGAGLPLGELLDKRLLLAAMPLHDYEELSILQKKWLRLWSYPWHQPIRNATSCFNFSRY